MIVVDTNIVGYLYLASEKSSKVELAFGKDPQWAAPLLWRSEFRNVLALYIRNKKLSFEDAVKIMNSASSLMGGREYEVPSLPVLKLVTESNCSAYNCEFVALAQELCAPLITVDQQILEQFPDTAVSLDEFVG